MTYDVIVIGRGVRDIEDFVDEPRKVLYEYKGSTLCRCKHMQTQCDQTPL